MAADVLRRIHRVLALLFLLSIPPAAWASFQGGDPADPSPLVYLPLFPMAILTLTGTSLLVRPWVQRWRKPKSAT